MKYKKYFIALAVLPIVLCCGGYAALVAYTQISDARRWDIPASFQESDLIGTWVQENVYFSETLTLSADHTYTQVYTNKTLKASQGNITSYQGEWSVEQHESGCIYLHLDGDYFLGRMGSLAKDSFF